MALPGTDTSQRRPSSPRPGVVTRRVASAAEQRRPRVRGRSDFGGCLLHRRQHRDERRRQEGGAVGHGGRQSGVVAHGRLRGQLARGHAPRPQSAARSTTSTIAQLRAGLEGRPQPRRAAPRCCARETPAHCRAQASARPGSARTSPTSSWAACPGVQKEGCDGLITAARWILHRMPRTRARCASSSSARRAKRFRRSSRSRTTWTHSASTAACSSPGSSTWTSATCARSATPPSPSAARCRRWRCSAISSARMRPRSRRATSEVVRIANARCGEGFIAVSAEARRKFWLDRARTAAIAKHTNAFKINEDVVIPLAAHGRVHRRHRAHQYRVVDPQQAGAAGELERCSACRCRSHAPRMPSSAAADRGAPRRARGAGARSCSSECARAGAGLLDASGQPLATRCAARALGYEALLPQLRARVTRSRAASLRSCCRTAASACRWKRELRAPLQQIFGGARVRADPRRVRRHAHGACCEAACSSRCTCTPATATCTPTFPVNSDDYAMLQTAQPRGGAHHGASRAA